MDKIFPASKFDLPLNLISGFIFIIVIRFFYGEYMNIDPVIELFMIPGVEKNQITIVVALASSYFTGFILAVIYDVLDRKFAEITIPSRVQYVLFGIGLDPKFKLFIGGRPLTKEQRSLFMQRARGHFHNLPRAFNKISDQQYVNLFYLAENAVRKDDAVYRHIQQTETRFAIAGRLAISLAAALLLMTLSIGFYAFFIASSPMIYAFIISFLHLFPLEFSILFTEFTHYLTTLDNSNISIMRLSFKSGSLLLLSAVPTSGLMAIFRFYHTKYDHDIFLYVVYNDMFVNKKDSNISEK